MRYRSRDGSVFTGPRPEDRVEWRAEIDTNDINDTLLDGTMLRSRGEPEIELTVYKLTVEEFNCVLDTINTMRGGQPSARATQAAERAVTMVAKKTLPKAQEPEPPKPPGVQDRFSGLEIE